MAVNPAGSTGSGPTPLSAAQLADASASVHAGASRLSLPANAEELSGPDLQSIYTGAPATYVQQDIDFWASSVGQVVRAVTLDSTATAADSYGDKTVYAGTTLMISGAGPKVTPATGTTSIGIASRTVNLRWGDEDIGCVVGGHVNQNRLTHAGTYGAALPAAVVTALNA